MKDDVRYKMYSQNRYRESLIIKSIDKLCRYEEMTCLLVDNPEHLYLTEQYIVTHNTTVIKEYCEKSIAKYSLPYEYEYVNELPKTLIGKVAFTKLGKENKNGK